MPPDYRVNQNHNPENLAPLKAQRGTRLFYERRPTEWTGWLWCWQNDGSASWVPEAWVRITGDECVLLRDYDARELRVQPGDRLTGLEVEAGWLWAETENNLRGWVPLACVEQESAPTPPI